MNLTKEQIEQIASTLTALAGTFAPDNAKSIVQLIAIATQLNNVIDSIKNQTEETKAEVWAEVRSNYADAVAEFEASVKPAP